MIGAAQRGMTDSKAVCLTVLLLLLTAGHLVASERSAPTPETFAAALQDAQNMPRLNSLLISHDGKLLVEEYFNGASAQKPANVKSVSKSFMSALIGIAIEQGVIRSLDQPIGDFYADLLPGEENAGKRAITIGNLLAMQAGLQSTSFRNYGAWVLSDDWIGFALDLPLESTPGTRMRYSTGNTHLLSGILTRATGMSTLQFARQNLTGPLGIQLSYWQADPDGIYFGGNNMEFTPRHMLVFGELYLNGGRRNGKQILSREWIDQSTQRLLESSREQGRFYGYGWWLRDMAGIEVTYAWGYGGQFILIAPALNLVVVTTSSSEPGDSRRRHTRNLYDLLERRIVEPLRIIETGTAVDSAG